MVFWRQWTGRRAKEASAAALLALICVGYSANAAIRAIIANETVPVTTTAPAHGYETDDHFPGAAKLILTAPLQAPTLAEAPLIKGATGTIALPDLPIPANAILPANDGTVHPAQPFSMAGASALDRSRALHCLTDAIYYEAANEPEKGQRAVAQVILNRARHHAFPGTVCGVIYQGSEKLTGCQFSYACDGSMARAPQRNSWARAMRVAADMLGGQVEASVGTATHYHTYAVTPSWNRSLVMTAAIGAHFFHRWQGYWGTPAAFRQRYGGGEPMPGPHPRPITAMPVITLAALQAISTTITATPIAPKPVTAAANIQPAYRASGTTLPSYKSTTADADSQILDRWKDSGKPLQ